MDKIDWKKVSQSEGYKSLKAAYEHDVQRNNKDMLRGFNPMRNKDEFYRKFKWVIARALHYANYWNQGNLTEALIHVLNAWELRRSYWWLNYYQNCNQPKLNHTCPSVTTKINLRKWCKKEDAFYARYETKPSKTYFKQLLKDQKFHSKRKGAKARYTKEQKERHKKYGVK